MADAISNIGGYGTYGVGYPQKRQEQDVQPDVKEGQQPDVKHENAEVDPNKVMEFLANNNYFIAPKVDAPNVVELDADTQERIENYMESFEVIYGIVLEEFGEELAPAVMDLVMDHLIGMTE